MGISTNQSKSQIKRTAAIATETVTTIGILTALAIICSTMLTFRAGTDFIKLSPTFIVIALAARRYGIYGAVIVSFASDFIQYLMAPLHGFSFGICFANIVLGIIFGLMFYKKINIKRIVIASLLVEIICDVIIKTFTMVYIEHWYPTVSSIIYFRLAQAGIMSAASIILLYILFIKLDIVKLTKVVK